MDFCRSDFSKILLKECAYLLRLPKVIFFPRLKGSCIYFNKRGYLYENQRIICHCIVILDVIFC